MNRCSPLKLPRYNDCSASQRADARKQLAIAMTQKKMFFDDDLSFPWPDCPPVCFNT
jgi:hypothetical protein